MRSSRTRSLAASAIALISAAFVAQAIPASASTAIRPGPGALDPKFMVLTPADLAPGSKVTAQRYYKDSDFPSVISYAREFDRGRVGLTSFLHSESDAEIGVGETVVVVLDSNHSLEHVAAELSAYAPMVSAGSYIVACDGIMAQVAGAPRTAPDWTWNNPLSAVENFLAGTNDFVREEPPFAFNEGRVRDRVTYWPKCFLKRVAGGAA